MNTTTAQIATTETAPAARPAGAPEHQHGWSVVSRHATSEGWLAYVRCEGCGSWRAERLGPARADRSALSRVIAPPH